MIRHSPLQGGNPAKSSLDPGVRRGDKSFSDSTSFPTCHDQLHDNPAHPALLLLRGVAALKACWFPISLAANTIRVLTLSLVTYYYGDEAGQGFLHGFAGIVLFMSALILIIAVDTLIHKFIQLRQRLRAA